MRILGAILASTLLAALTATSAAANCDPTAEPDKTDIANARAAVEAHCACATATSHGAYVSCAAQQANAVLVNKSCASAVKKCAGKSTCGRPGTVTCCRTTGRGRTSCSLKRSASRCAAPHGGQACVGSFASCCDACNVTGCVATTTTSTSTTSTSTTTTTLGPICGDDQINQSSEECDGTARGDCVVAPELACGAPGGTAPCQCCIPPGATHPIGAGGPQCCDGQPEPLGPGVVACPNTTGRCDPPSICPLGTCQADGSCCAAAGTACVFYYAPPVTYGASAACCSGLACRTVVPPAPGALHAFAHDAIRGEFSHLRRAHQSSRP